MEVIRPALFQVNVRLWPVEATRLVSSAVGVDRVHLVAVGVL